MDKLRVREVILVEGKYDKIALEAVVDGLIFPVDGFAIFHDTDRRELLRRLAAERGVVILTDSDGGGVVIRRHLKSILPPEQVKEAFIPDVPGKEKRKRAPGKAGTLGVEGMRPEVLRQALLRAGVGLEEEREKPFTKAVLYALGLSGTPEAKQRRLALQAALGLPANLSANALTGVLNAITTPAEVEKLFFHCDTGEKEL